MGYEMYFATSLCLIIAVFLSTISLIILLFKAFQFLSLSSSLSPPSTPAVFTPPSSPELFTPPSSPELFTPPSSPELFSEQDTRKISREIRPITMFPRMQKITLAEILKRPEEAKRITQPC